MKGFSFSGKMRHAKDRKIFIVLWLVGLNFTFHAVRVNVSRYLRYDSTISNREYDHSQGLKFVLLKISCSSTLRPYTEFWISLWQTLTQAQIIVRFNSKIRDDAARLISLMREHSPKGYHCLLIFRITFFFIANLYEWRRPNRPDAFSDNHRLLQ